MDETTSLFPAVHYHNDNNDVQHDLNDTKRNNHLDTLRLPMVQWEGRRGELLPPVGAYRQNSAVIMVISDATMLKAAAISVTRSAKLMRFLRLRRTFLRLPIGTIPLPSLFAVSPYGKYIILRKA